MMIDTAHNNRDRWIKEIGKHIGEEDTWHIIQYALSFTLQACRHNETNRYKWRD